MEGDVKRKREDGTTKLVYMICFDGDWYDCHEEPVAIADSYNRAIELLTAIPERIRSAQPESTHEFVRDEEKKVMAWKKRKPDEKVLDYVGDFSIVPMNMNCLLPNVGTFYYFFGGEKLPVPKLAE